MLNTIKYILLISITILPELGMTRDCPSDMLLYNTGNTSDCVCPGLAQNLLNLANNPNKLGMCPDSFQLHPNSPLEADPSTASNIVFWIDTSNPFGTGYLPYMTSSTTTFSRLADLSSGANHASYVNTGGTINTTYTWGRSAIGLDFANNNGYYQSPSFSVDFSLGLTVVAVYLHYYNNPASNGAIIDRGVAANNTDRFFIRQVSGTNQLRFEVSNPSTSANLTLSQFTYYVLAGVFDPSLGSNNLSFSAFSSGGTSSSSANSVTPLGNNSRPFNIGIQLATNSYFRGWIQEIIVYNRPLNSTSLTNVRRYLSRKWGVL
jgi:hypothetical protein